MILAALLLATPAVALPQDAPDTDWPHLRGPRYDGRTAAGVFPEEPYGLSVLWRAELGAAYSGTVVSAGRAVTCYSDGTHDGIVALDAEDGSLLWRRELGPVYLGHDGSEDGPIATPTIGAGSVVVIDPRGMLRVLALETGAVQWEKDLVSECGTVVPEYGFTSTPAVEGERVLVQAGGSEGRLLCAFDLEDGELLWSAGEGEAGYTSPVVLDLAGRRQVLVLSNQLILGLDPTDGSELWRHALTGRDRAGSGMATRLDDGHFLAPISGRQLVFSIAPEDGGFAVEIASRLRELGRTYAAPVLFEGHLYGFTSEFLTCVNLESGKRVWKSRPPGGRGLALVGDRLVIFGSEGNAVVARATPEGYVEEARTKVLERNGYAWPAFAGGRMYLRSSEGLACVGVQGTAGTPVATPRGSRSALEQRLEALAAEPEAARRIEGLLADLEAFPHVEPGDGDTDSVTFLWKGAAEDVALIGPLLEGNQVRPMRRLADTDVFVTSAPLASRARAEYRFQVDYDQRVPDPRTPLAGPGRRGDETVSIVTGSKFDAPALPERRGEPESVLVEHTFESPSLGNTRKVQVYLPPGGEDEALPLVVIQQGSDWLARGDLHPLLDGLMADAVRPCAVAFVDTIGEWWFEAGGTGTEEYLSMLEEELLPFLAEQHLLTDDPAERLLVGLEGFGLSAVYGALSHPGAFGNAAGLSVALEDVARHALFDRIAKDPRPDVQLFVGWNRYEERSADRGYDRAEESQRLFDALSGRGFRVTGGPADDSFGWTGWRARMAEVLGTFFPKTD